MINIMHSGKLGGNGLVVVYWVPALGVALGKLAESSQHIGNSYPNCTGQGITA